MTQTAPVSQPRSRRFMTWLLRSPFHIFTNGLLLITVTGRKSGRAISTPVNYARDHTSTGDRLLITSKIDRTWWKNLRGGAAVTVLINGQTYHAEANVLEDRAAVERELLCFFRLIKRTIAGIHLDQNGQPTKPDKFARVAQSRVVIELTHLTAS